MSKRIVCLILALIMFVGLIPAGAISASAASNRSVSENAVKFIKDWEGYTKKAYADGMENGVQRYSYGYGTKAPNAEAIITEAQADAALREELKEIDKKVNNFAAAHNKNFTQSQHDALVSFSYNVGWGWMSQLNYRITKAILNGAKGNDFLQAMCLWSNVDSLPVHGLVQRRMAEADMYLNASYTKSARASFTYVKFDANGGVLGEDKVQAYDYNAPVTITSVPTKEGSTFLGWYLTTSADASWVGVLNKDVAGKTLYARWQNNNEMDEGGKIVGTPANYIISGLNFASNKVYEVPNANNASVETINQNDNFKVTAEYVDNSGEKWLKINSGWVKLGEIKVSASNTSAVTVTVTNAFVNIRKEPNTDPTNAPIGSLQYGQKVVITATQEVNGALWGKHEKGWSALMYTNYGTVSSSNTTSGNGNGAKIAEGTVLVNAINLNVRTGAGTDHGIVGSLPKNTKIDIFEIVTVNGHGWGRIDAGKWVCLDYVNYKMLASTTVKEETASTNTSNEEPYKFKATVNADGLNVYEDPTALTNVAKPIASLNKNDNVNILDMVSKDGLVFGKIITKNMVGWIQLDQVTYTAAGVVSNANGASINVYGAVGAATPINTLKNGTAVTILEVKANGNAIWGRVKEGWVELDCVKLNTTKPTIITGAQASTTTTTTTTEKVIYTGLVNSGINLNVRLGAGVEYDIVNSLAHGTQIKVYDKTVINGHYWGKLGDNAWVCLTYVTETTNTAGANGSATDGNTNTSTSVSGGAAAVSQMATVINCTTGVNIRSTPSVTGALLGSAPLNSRVKVLETTVYNGTKWARTESGWISMLYLKLDSEVNYANNSSVNVNGLFSATVLVNQLNVYDSLIDANVVKNGTVITTMNKGASAYVSEIQSKDGGYVSGKVTVNGKTGWIDLSDTSFTARGQVNTSGDNLNVRIEPKATATKVKELTNGTSISIVDIRADVAGATTTLWGKISLTEWVDLAYVNLVATASNATSTTTQSGLGKIAYTDTVNVRKAAGTNNAIVTLLNRGTEVILHEETVVDEAVWVRISTASVNGWVAKDYIEVIYAPTTNNNTTNNTTNNTVPQQPVQTSNYMTGMVNTNNLKIRQEPDINAAIVDKLQSGMTVTIYEQRRGGNLDWGRVDKGWVALNYITLTSTGSTGAGDMGTVIKAFSTVRVRAEATTESAQVGELMVGSRVEVLDQKYVNGYTWYRVYNGWVHGDYIELDAPFVGHQTPNNNNTATNDPAVTGPKDEVADMSTTAVLKHRTNDFVQFYNNDMTPNTTKLVNGETVVITGLKGIGTDVWAKTKHGWFNLTDESINFIAVGKVNTANDNYLNVYSEVGKDKTEPVDKIRDQASITLTGLAVSTTTNSTSKLWGKTASGWVNMTEVELTAIKEAYAKDQQTQTLPVIAIKSITEQFNAKPKAQHLSINVYNAINGYAVGIIANNTNIEVKKIQANNSDLWLCIESTDGKEYWIKYTDVTIVDDGINNGNVIMACDMTSSAGGSSAVQTLALNNGVRFSDFTIYGNEIYAYGTANGKSGWVNTKFLHKWANLPATEIAERTSAIIAADYKAITYTYDAANGKVVGTLHDGDPTNHKIWIKEVVANGGIVWGKTTVKDNQTRWIKMSDVTYSIPAKVVEECFAMSGAGSNIAMETAFKKGNDVTVNNLTAVGNDIYAQITSATNNGGWLKNTQLSVWTALPKVGVTPITSASGVLCKTTINPSSVRTAAGAGDDKILGYIETASTVLVTNVQIAGGEIWAEIPVTIIDSNYQSSNKNVWVKYSQLNGFSATATTDAALNVRSSMSTADSSNILGELAAGTTVQIVLIRPDGLGNELTNMWAQIVYNGANAYVNMSHLVLARGAY